MRSYMKDRARELYHFLVEVATTEAIPKVSEKSGMIIVGWSLGSAWITALLAHLEEFEGAGIMLQSYARKFICLGAHANFGLSYPPSSHFLPFY